MRKAQSILEYSILLIVIIAALMTMQTYMKRGFQGRWKASVDEMGEQYDTKSLDSNLRQTLSTDSETSITIQDKVQNGVNGTHTYRIDTTSSNETKTGTTHIEREL